MWVTDRVAQIFFPFFFTRHAYVHTHTLFTHTYTPTRSGSKLKRGDTDHSLSVCARWESATQKDDVCLAASRQNCTLGCASACTYACLPSIARYDTDVVLRHHITPVRFCACRTCRLLRDLKLFSAPLYFGLVYSRSGLHL